LKITTILEIKRNNGSTFPVTDLTRQLIKYVLAELVIADMNHLLEGSASASELDQILKQE
jgi:hypothetical protein